MFLRLLDAVFVFIDPRTCACCSDVSKYRISMLEARMSTMERVMARMREDEHTPRECVGEMLTLLERAVESAV
jgi:hypothetical protein